MDGTIKLFTELPVCDSCHGAINQFKKMFLGIRVEVYSDEMFEDKDDYMRTKKLMRNQQTREIKID